MLCIATTIHDPTALTSVCRRIKVSAEQDRDDGRIWRIRLWGLCAPITVNTLTGIITYDGRDNGFGRYRIIMHLIHRIYDAQAQRLLAHTPRAA